MNRRSFFKVIAAVCGSMAVPSMAKSMLASGAISYAVKKGLVREVVAYDIEQDMMVARWDVKTDKGQWNVSQSLYLADSVGTYEYRRDASLKRLRQTALSMLDEMLKKNHQGWVDVKQLRLPEGVNHAVYL